ncbi:MAG TPA: sigma factor-like helix-turn-helix DNA-binding protein, partial [Solirubrobacteraceae bacterium]|nr:sigma factor-like helix-turn-helix DNA-binding protein [Solirubrobacteraceae bacterium]
AAMDDLGRFVVRMLGDSPAARAADERARGGGGDGERTAMLRAAVAAVRQGAEPAPEPSPTAPAATDPDAGDRPTDPARLADAVAGELAAACDRLPIAEREVLALRELLGLSYDEIADVTDVERDAVAPLLARARLHLREALRGAAHPEPACDERERALRTIALRQDGEEVLAADENWLIDHLGHCRGCRQVHAAMLEASACYRAWTSPEVPSDPVAEAGTGS